ncbi:MAG: hypothetical protein U0K57_05320 [Lachnospiraceae bacterium]|nr:hypothetical protein [Lachnospiraceae bacterium]
MRQKQEGHYHNDYSPRYHKPYDIYDKACDHMRRLKKEENEKNIDKKSNKEKNNNIQNNM